MLKNVGIKQLCFDGLFREENIEGSLKMTANQSDIWTECTYITTDAHTSYNHTFSLAFDNHLIYLRQKVLY
jgi:hypothetical protein